MARRAEAAGPRPAVEELTDRPDGAWEPAAPRVAAARAEEEAEAEARAASSGCFGGRLGRWFARRGGRR